MSSSEYGFMNYWIHMVNLGAGGVYMNMKQVRPSSPANGSPRSKFTQDIMIIVIAIVIILLY